MTFNQRAQSSRRPEVGQVPTVLHFLARPSYAGCAGAELVFNVDRASDA
jgi:hypothetical protein